MFSVKLVVWTFKIIKQNIFQTTITESTFHNMNIQKYLSYNLDVKFE